MTDQELGLAITTTREMVRGTSASENIYRMLERHFEALLAEQLRRAQEEKK